jgi:hypothetical protein
MQLPAVARARSAHIRNSAFNVNGDMERRCYSVRRYLERQQSSDEFSNGRVAVFSGANLVLHVPLIACISG